MRRATATWRQPRLAVGLLLVLGSVLLGAQIFTAADDSVSVWTVRVDVAAGQQITGGMLEARRIRFADAQQADRYLPGDQELPLPSVVTRPLQAGELLPRSALGLTERLAEVPLQALLGNVPSTVHVGNVVDVWVADGSEAARAVLENVPVLALEQSGTGVRVVVGLNPAQASAMPSLFAELAGTTVFVVGRSQS